MAETQRLVIPREAEVNEAIGDPHPAMQADIAVVASTDAWCQFSAMLCAARVLLDQFAGGPTSLTRDLAALERQLDRFGQQATAERGERLARHCEELTNG